MHGVPTISKDFEIFFANPHNTAEVLMPTFTEVALNSADWICCAGTGNHTSILKPPAS